MKLQENRPVELRSLTEAAELGGLLELHMSNPSAPVRAVALVGNFEELVEVGPDTVILLSPGVAQGSWMISAALRYAWERRACALIAPEQSLAETVIELARRLEISLFMSGREMTQLALDTAINIGIARAGSLARLQAFSRRLSEHHDLKLALQFISEELDGARIIIESGGAPTLHSRPLGPPTRDISPTGSSGTTRITEILSATEESEQDTTDVLVAEVLPASEIFGQELLAVASPTVRALLAEFRLLALQRSLPLLSAALLVGAPRTAGAEARHLSTDLASRRDLIHWPASAHYTAVFFAATHGEQAAAIIHQAWNRALPKSPLAVLADGWLGFAPLVHSSERELMIESLRNAVGPAAQFGIRIGVANPRSKPEEATEAVREAWIASRLAEPYTREGSAVVEFIQVASNLGANMLPAEFAEQLSQALIPDLLDDPAGEELARCVVAYFEHNSSVSAAADALGVHRNTLQTRLRRAEALGVHVNEPKEVLTMHLLLSALLRVDHWRA